MTGYTVRIRSTPAWADYYLAVCVAENCSRARLFEQVCEWYAGGRVSPPATPNYTRTNRTATEQLHDRG